MNCNGRDRLVERAKDPRHAHDASVQMMKFERNDDVLRYAHALRGGRLPTRRRPCHLHAAGRTLLNVVQLACEGEKIPNRLMSRGTLASAQAAKGAK